MQISRSKMTRPYLDTVEFLQKSADKDYITKYTVPNNLNGNDSHK